MAGIESMSFHCGILAGARKSAFEDGFADRVIPTKEFIFTIS